MKTAVVIFPGTSGDRELIAALEAVTGRAPAILWHDEPDIPSDIDFIGLPGGLSYGNYLRPGALAARTPVMQGIAKAAKAGTPILGIGNGFQILTEAGILPGTLLQNSGLEFICRDTQLTVATTDTPFTKGYQADTQITLPVAHADGNYRADEATLDLLEGEGRVAFYYADNVNGAARNIAAIVNEKRNVLGMMPHPERMADKAHGGFDGRILFESLVGALV